MTLNTTSRVRSENNALERLVFNFLNRNRIYYQKHYARAPGRPDIALPRKKKAVFINGDFWHGRNFERRRPQLSEYWLAKIQRNMARDVRIAQELDELGWKYLVVWESDLRRKSTSMATLESVINFMADSSNIQ